MMAAAPACAFAAPRVQSPRKRESVSGKNKIGIFGPPQNQRPGRHPGSSSPETSGTRTPFIKAPYSGRSIVQDHTSPSSQPNSEMSLRGSAGIVISAHLPAPVMTESTVKVALAIHMLCWSWAICLLAAASSESTREA
jgi:hypothetical protein